MKLQVVYVVESGPGYEAADDIEVFSTRDKAERYAEQCRRSGWSKVHALMMDFEDVTPPTPNSGGMG